MQFIIEDRVFDILPEVCFGVVVARGLDNSGLNNEIKAILQQAIEEAREKFRVLKPKEHPDLKPFREAFRKMAINPNKFPCSVEALSARVARGGSFPEINPAVNLVNAYSLRYTLPMGAHDIDAVEGNIEVRFSRNGDRFIPFGGQEPEILEEGELVYAAGSTIKTRKWIWRQSDAGKVTAESKNVFFPIDGFIGHNRAAVMAARNELAAALELMLKARTSLFYLDSSTRSITL
jgi:DNA/RNA-binding domain of Phe-tRNA-synthetase-like protein